MCSLCAQQRYLCSEPGEPWFIRTPDSKHHCSKCDVGEKSKRRLKPCNAKRHAMEDKSEAKNHGKIDDARHKTENKGPTACMGIKACTGGNKMRKATTKMKSVLKNSVL